MNKHTESGRYSDVAPQFLPNHCEVIHNPAQRQNGERWMRTNKPFFTVSHVKAVPLGRSYCSQLPLRQILHLWQSKKQEHAVYSSISRSQIFRYVPNGGL